MLATQIMQLDISKLKNLPALPENSGRILAAVNDPDIALEELVRVISTSPILVARLLGLANSAYFGFPGKVINLRLAIINVLGLKIVKSLCLSILLSLSFDTKKCQHFDSERFWHNTLLTAVGAQKVALALNDEAIDSGFFYTSGILLQIGLLAAVFVYPEEMDAILLLEKKGEFSLNKLMSQYYEVDQYEMGSYLLQRWQLPSLYQEIVMYYADIKYSGKKRLSIDIVRVASLLVRMLNNDKYILLVSDESLLQSISLSENSLLLIKQEMGEKMNDFKSLVQVMVG